jgi:hypothetical protein
MAKQHSHHSLRQLVRPPARWAVLAVSAILLLAILAIWQVWFPGRAFDAAAWQDEAQVQQGVRLKMADRLIARNTLYRKSRAEVVQLLGEPPPTGYFADWDLVYWLGPERGFISIDSEWLVLRLDQDRRVVHYRIVRD